MFTPCNFRGPPGFTTPFAPGYCFQTPYAINSPSLTSPDSGEGKQGFGYVSDNPRVVNSMNAQEYRAFLTAHKIPPPDYLPSTSVLTILYKGELHLAVPLSTTSSILPNSVNCIKTLWQCNRFCERDPIAYQHCKQQESCFLYNTLAGDGRLIPICVKLNSFCLAAWEYASTKCKTKLGIPHMDQWPVSLDPAGPH